MGELSGKCEKRIKRRLPYKISYKLTLISSREKDLRRIYWLKMAVTMTPTTTHVETYPISNM